MGKSKQELKSGRPVIQPLFTYEQLNTITNFQRLWTHIANWTRAFTQSAVFDLPNLNAVSDKLKSLPMDFYDIMKSFYGPENTKTFIDLLSDYISSAVRTIEGIRDSDQIQVNLNAAQWYRAADQIAHFLASINVYWDEKQWRSLLYQFIQLMLTEVMAVLESEFIHENELWEIIEDLTFNIGSYMARGIIAMNQYQFEYQDRQSTFN